MNSDDDEILSQINVPARKKRAQRVEEKENDDSRRIRTNARREFNRQVSNTSSNFIESVADSEEFCTPKNFAKRNGNSSRLTEDVSQVAETEFDTSPVRKSTRSSRSTADVSQIAETEFESPPAKTTAKRSARLTADVSLSQIAETEFDLPPIRKKSTKSSESSADPDVSQIAETEFDTAPARKKSTRSTRLTADVSHVSETQFDTAPVSKKSSGRTQTSDISQIPETEFAIPISTAPRRKTQKARDSQASASAFSYGTLSVTQSSQHVSTQSSSRSYSNHTQSTRQEATPSNSSKAGSSKSCGSQQEEIKINIASGFHCGYEINPDGYKIFDEFITRSGKGAERAHGVVVAGNLFHAAHNHFSSLQRVSRSINNNIYREQLPDDAKMIQSRKANLPKINQRRKMPVLAIAGRCDRTILESNGKHATKQTYGSPYAVLEISGIAQSLDNPKLCLAETWSYSPTVFKQGNFYVVVYGISFIAKTYISQLAKAKFVKPAIPAGASFKTMLVLSNSMEKPPAILKKLAKEFDVVVWGGENAPSKVETRPGYHAISTGETLIRFVHEGQKDRKEFQQIIFSADKIRVTSHELASARHLVIGSLVLHEWINDFHDRESYEEEFDNAIFEKTINLLRDYPMPWTPMPAMILKIDLRRPGKPPLETINPRQAGMSLSRYVWNWKSCLRYEKGEKKKKNADGKDLEGDGLLSEPLMDTNRNIIAGVLNEKIEDEGVENLSGKIGKDITEAYGVGDTQSVLDVCKWMKVKLLKDSDDLFIKDTEATIEIAEEALEKAGNAVKVKLEEKELNAIDLARREIEKGIIPNGDLKGFQKQEMATKAAKTKSKEQASAVSDESLDFKNPFEDSDEDVQEVVPQSRSKRSRR